MLATETLDLVNIRPLIRRAMFFLKIMYKLPHDLRDHQYVGRCTMTYLALTNNINPDERHCKLINSYLELYFAVPKVSMQICVYNTSYDKAIHVGYKCH